LLGSCAHLLVDLCTVVETLLTSAGHSPAHTGRVPSTNAGHLRKRRVEERGKCETRLCRKQAEEKRSKEK